MTKKKMNWGKAKFEILTLRIEIMEGLLRGDNLSEIHRSLTEQGKTKTAKSTFLLHAKDLREEALEILKNQYSRHTTITDNASTTNDPPGAYESKLGKRLNWQTKPEAENKVGEEEQDIQDDSW